MTMARIDVFALRNERHVAYCYQGSMRGAVAIFVAGRGVSIFYPKNYILDKSENQYSDYTGNFELWELIHEIEDENIKSEAVTKFYSIYCTFYSTLDYIRNGVFEGFNSDIG